MSPRAPTIDGSLQETSRDGNGYSGDDNATGFALYLIDMHGNKELIHRDLIYSSAFPIPLRARQRPPVLPDMTDPKQEMARAFVSDVYHDLEGIERGEAKYLRISQRFE